MVCTGLTSSSLHRSRPLGVVIRSILMLALLSAAAVMAPEDPKAQASICQRHHSQDACRVW
ncbi:MAG: hypothetical protein CBD48_02755 [Cyanobacteria bacterium TMED188]|nr:MAG: hypothetical protein CBD48_02755 [Cyanobacteria bacterium TMED188]